MDGTTDPAPLLGRAVPVPGARLRQRCERLEHGDANSAVPTRIRSTTRQSTSRRVDRLHPASRCRPGGLHLVQERELSTERVQLLFDCATTPNNWNRNGYQPEAAGQRPALDAAVHRGRARLPAVREEDVPDPALRHVLRDGRERSELPRRRPVPSAKREAVDVRAFLHQVDARVRRHDPRPGLCSFIDGGSLRLRPSRIASGGATVRPE